MLALRYGWLARDFVDLSLLQHPPVQPRYPRQTYWQKDMCADGQHHVTGKPQNLAWSGLHDTDHHTQSQAAHTLLWAFLKGGGGRVLF